MENINKSSSVYGAAACIQNKDLMCGVAQIGQSLETNNKEEITTRGQETDPLPTHPKYLCRIKTFERQINEVTAKSEKFNIVKKMNEIDHEIAEVERHMQNLRLQEIGIQKDMCQSHKTNRDKDVELFPKQPCNIPVEIKIYSQNREVAQKSHSEIQKISHHESLPLYHQPSVCPVYNENKIKHEYFCKRLILHLTSKKKERIKKLEMYAHLQNKWLRTVEEMELDKKRQEASEQYKKIFENEFPELKQKAEKQEKAESFNKVRTRARMENQYRQKRAELQKMQLGAVIPPPLFCAQPKQSSYINNNNRIDDLALEYNAKQSLTVWTAPEIAIFKEKFLRYPKQFSEIASYLINKTAFDCVKFYYTSKKEVNYKQLLQMQRRRPSRTLQEKENNQSMINGIYKKNTPKNKRMKLMKPISQDSVHSQTELLVERDQKLSRHKSTRN